MNTSRRQWPGWAWVAAVCILILAGTALVWANRV